MKAIVLLLFLWVSLAHGETPTIELEPNRDDTLNLEYGEQLQKRFNALLESDKDLQAQFAVFEGAPKERSGGRYMGSNARPLLLHESIDVDFRDDGGRRDYTQTFVIYYSFAEGNHKGMEATSGVFAVFHLVGQQVFDHKGGDDFELVKHTVTARFDGFRRTLNAEQLEAADASPAP